MRFAENRFAAVCRGGVWFMKKQVGNFVTFLAKLTKEEREWLREEGYRTRTDSRSVLRDLIVKAMKKQKQ